MAGLKSFVMKFMIRMSRVSVLLLLWELCETGDVSTCIGLFYLITTRGGGPGE